MSHLRYYAYDGVGKRNLEKYYYSQAIEKTFENIELNLKDAGGAGWCQVYKIRSYHIELSPEALGATIAAIRKWCPDHAPVWTCVGVTALGEEGMLVEVEVEAQIPKEA
ncbi:hypothetical protein HOY80DRAFT_1007897 [Tuber brumale]|nr:hypothetical protein HOY80DRAFT_1007897 [Tuber brumale]